MRKAKKKNLVSYTIMVIYGCLSILLAITKQGLWITLLTLVIMYMQLQDIEITNLRAQID